MKRQVLKVALLGANAVLMAAAVGMVSVDISGILWGSLLGGIPKKSATNKNRCRNDVHSASRGATVKGVLSLW